MFIWAISAVVAVSLVSLVGVVLLGCKREILNKLLTPLIAFAAGALLGDAFIHLLPEAVEDVGFGPGTSFLVIGGILLAFVVEKYIHWHHCRKGDVSHVHKLAAMNVVGDGIHNFIDGLAIGASFLVSPTVGVATTIAVILHEIPQEIGDFSILLYSGLSRAKAILYNLASAAVAILGVLVVFALGERIEEIEPLLLLFAAGNFIYIALADIVPELHKKERPFHGFIHVIAIIAGCAIMLGLTLFE
jgi:zinc and cadmium transporter